MKLDVIQNGLVKRHLGRFRSILLFQVLKSLERCPVFIIKSARLCPVCSQSRSKTIQLATDVDDLHQIVIVDRSDRQALLVQRADNSVFQQYPKRLPDRSTRNAQLLCQDILRQLRSRLEFTLKDGVKNGIFDAFHNSRLRSSFCTVGVHG